jgi:hypothetical protein
VSLVVILDMSLILLRYGRPNAPDMESMDSELPPEPFRLPPSLRC